MIWISSRGNGTTTFLPSFLPFFAYRCRDLFDIILPLEKVPNEFDSIPTNHRVGREKGGEELSHRAGWVFDRRINIRSIASLPSLIVALSCKEMVIYRKKWWFEDSLILTTNTYIHIYFIYKRELRFQKELLLLLWSDDGKWMEGFHLCCRRIVSLLRTKRSVTR